MKKIVMFVVLLFAVVLMAGCKKYEEEAGVYELYSMTGDLDMTLYKFYTIELKANGKYVVKAEYTQQATKYEAEGKYTIKDGKINLTSTVGSTKVVETYDYIDGEIIMDAKIEGLQFVAKFKRAE